ncbi:MAG: chorismate mutase, partial [Planctomycetes bacterium]|nr:chorismate mutase [Planctomycetota bacterium]
MTDDRTTAGLDALRSRIAGLDRDLLALLAQRMEAVRQVGAWKAQSGSEGVQDRERERALTRIWCEEAETVGLPAWLATRILREILEHSRRLQEGAYRTSDLAGDARRVVVGYQGVAGSYSELCIDKALAAREERRVVKQGFETFAAVATALETEEIDYALLPIENTICGGIGEV